MRGAVSLEEWGAGNGERLPVCVQVCAVPTLGSDGLRLSVENSRLQWALRACPRHRTHTNARMQWSFQGVAAVCSLSLHPGGAARLTKTDWQCQELRAQRLDLHKNFELLHKCLFGGDPSQSSVSRTSKRETELGVFAN